VNKRAIKKVFMLCQSLYVKAFTIERVFEVWSFSFLNN